MHTTMLWQLRRVLDRDQMIADAAEVSERPDRLGRIVEQRRLERRIGPSPRDDPRADMRADLGLVGFDDAVERCGLDIALLDEDRLQRAHPKLDFG